MRYVENPPNPYDRYSSEFLGEPPDKKLEIYEETLTKSMIVRSWSPDFGSRYIVNCYRGCIHGCTYCFARQYHEFLGFGAGTDFETKIVAKVNGPEVLRNELKRTRKELPFLEFSFATDPYLQIEANYRLTRKCLEICREFRIPVRILTKSPLVTRDIDLIKDLNADVAFSIPFLSVKTSKPFEPFVPTPEVRFRAMRQLADEGIRVGLALAPVIPGYNDAEIPKLLEKARENGASKAFMSLIHIDTDSVEKYFVQKMEEKIPTKAGKILTQLKREKGGTLRHRNSSDRGKGRTEQWEITKRVFELHFERLGFEKFERLKENALMETLPVQQKLF